MVQLRALFVICYIAQMILQATFRSFTYDKLRNFFTCDTRREYYAVGIMDLPEPDIKQWIAITEVLSSEPIRSMIYARTPAAASARKHSAAKKRAALWIALAKHGVSPIRLASAFNVSQEAVRKVLREDERAFWRGDVKRRRSGRKRAKRSESTAGEAQMERDS
jgi:hypothetical protein